MDAMTIIQVFPTILDGASMKIKVKDLDFSLLSKTVEMDAFRELIELYGDETIEDAKQLMSQLSGSIHEQQTMDSFHKKLDDMELKGFNETKNKK